MADDQQLAAEHGTGGRPRAARTQQQRRAQTQSKIIDAVIACLIDDGHHAVSFGNAAARAGVSRGAVLHHFPDRAALMTAAIERLWQARRAALRAELERLPENGDRVARALDLLWQSFSGPLWSAALEVWGAARTDDHLRETLLPLERQLTDDVRRISAHLVGPPAAGAPELDVLVDSGLATMRGLAMLASHYGDPDHISATWRYSRAVLLEQIRALQVDGAGARG